MNFLRIHSLIFVSRSYLFSYILSFSKGPVIYSSGDHGGLQFKNVERSCTPFISVKKFLYPTEKFVQDFKPNCMKVFQKILYPQLSFDKFSYPSQLQVPPPPAHKMMSLTDLYV